MECVVATGNPGKVVEIRAILAEFPLVLRGLAEFPPLEFPPEGDAYEPNAVEKARVAAGHTGLAALADDSGLEVEALAGRPGVRSARYGGPGLDDAGRVSRLLAELDGVHASSRRARFVCVAACVLPSGEVHTARGECAGHILAEPRGEAGFGYDPVFRPLGEAGSMAELAEPEKNAISHRGRAFRALARSLVAGTARPARAG